MIVEFFILQFIKLSQIEIASDSDIEEVVEKNNEEKTIEKSDKVIETNEDKACDANSKIDCLDISSQSSPIPLMDDTINTSLKYVCSRFLQFSNLSKRKIDINLNLTQLRFSQNSNILCSFGSQYSEDEWLNRSKVRYSVEVFDKKTALTDRYKYMSLKIVEANEILNEKIDEFSEEIRQTLDIESWSRFSLHSPNESYYIGRVCHDCSNNKLDEHSIRFETSAYISNNESIRLDLTHLKSFSLFSGQVLACKAINELGNALFVQEIIDFDKMLSLPKTVPDLKRALDIVVAVGPFNNSLSLNYEYLRKLLEYVKQYEPDFCVLIGPFVDSLNEKLMTCEESINRLFSSQIRFISEELSDIKTEAIVIPSTRDLNIFNVLPTMPFDSFKASKIHYFSNPTVLNINGIVIGITSTDVLLHMSKEEISV